MKRISWSALGLCLMGLMLAGPGQVSAAILGFDNGSGFMVNDTTGTATMANGVLTLTNNLQGEAHTVFNTTVQDVRIISTNFTYQASGDKNGEGFAFVLQDDTRGAGALGFGGAGLGYFGIFPSFALEVNLNSANTRGIAFGQATSSSNGTIGPYIAPGSINLASGDRIGFSLLYNGTTMAATLTDLDNTSIPSFTISTAVNIPSILGSNTAFVGFAGASGAANAKSTQTLSNFTYFNVIPEPSSIIMAMTACVSGLAVWRLARRKAAAA